MTQTNVSEAKTAGEMTVAEWKPMRRGESLRGFLTLVLPSGMQLHECTLHQRETGARWIGLPAKQFTKPDGTVQWTRIVDFTEQTTYSNFQRQALKAVDGYLAQLPEPGKGKTAPLFDRTKPLFEEEDVR